MPDWLTRSRETTWCGLGAGLGVLVLLLGLAFSHEAVTKLGTTIVGAAAMLMGFFARSERQHEADAPKVKQDIAAEVKAEVRDELRHS